MQNKKYIINNINNYLNNLKFMINNGAKIILSNRHKNMLFCEINNIRVVDIKNLLLNLCINDFCKILKNKGINNEEELYLFSKYVKIKNMKTSQQIYIKINKIKNKNVIILVSFHRSRYLLKNQFNIGSDNNE